MVGVVKGIAVMSPARSPGRTATVQSPPGASKETVLHEKIGSMIGTEKILIGVVETAELTIVAGIAAT